MRGEVVGARCPGWLGSEFVNWSQCGWLWLWVLKSAVLLVLCGL